MISEPAEITIDGQISDYNGSGVSCNGYNDGWINIDVSNGSGSFIYNWVTADGNLNGQDANEDLTGLVAGTYSLLVEDLNGCEANSEYVITEPSPLNIDFITVIQDGINCNGDCEADLVASVSGGTEPYVFNWIQYTGGVPALVSGFSSEDVYCFN